MLANFTEIIGRSGFIGGGLFCRIVERDQDYKRGKWMLVSDHAAAGSGKNMNQTRVAVSLFKNTISL